MEVHAKSSGNFKKREPGVNLWRHRTFSKSLNAEKTESRDL